MKTTPPKKIFSPKKPNTKKQFTELSSIEKKVPTKQITGKKTAPKKTDTRDHLTKYLAHSGLCSRRNALEVIKSGDIAVNGKTVRDAAFRLEPHDIVTYKTKPIKPEKKIYLALNKPKDYITTLYDPYHSKTIFELIKTATKERLYPVGRLDRETTGIILITNDGELTQKLAHPKHEVTKVYHVILNKPLHKDDLEKIRNGIHLYDGKIAADRTYYVAGKPKHHIGIEIHSGKNRIVRRILKHLGYNVIQLDRVAYAGITKKGLPVGKWRFLTEAEIEKLLIKK